MGKLLYVGTHGTDGPHTSDYAVHRSRGCPETRPQAVDFSHGRIGVLAEGQRGRHGERGRIPAPPAATRRDHRSQGSDLRLNPLCWGP